MAEEYDFFVLWISFLCECRECKAQHYPLRKRQLFLTAKMSHTGKTQERTCCPCFMLIHLIHHACLTGTAGRGAAIWEVTVTDEALLHLCSLIRISIPLIHFLAQGLFTWASYAKGWISNIFKQRLRVGKGIRKTGTQPNIYISLLLLVWNTSGLWICAT